MLHSKRCVLCDKANGYYDAEQSEKVDPDNDRIVRDLLLKLHKYKTKPNVDPPTVGTVSPRRLVPELTQPS